MKDSLCGCTTLGLACQRGRIDHQMRLTNHRHWNTGTSLILGYSQKVKARPPQTSRSGCGDFNQDMRHDVIKIFSITCADTSRAPTDSKSYEIITQNNATTLLQVGPSQTSYPRPLVRGRSSERTTGSFR